MSRVQADIGRTSDSSSFQAKPVQNNWNININSPEIVGQITCPKIIIISLITAIAKNQYTFCARRQPSGCFTDVKSLLRYQ